MWSLHSLKEGAISQTDLKRYYLAMIVYEVINHDGLTKREICDLTGFSWGLVSRSVNQLETRGYFGRSTIRKKPGSGRNAFDYTISGERFATIGVSIEADRLLACSLTLAREPMSLLEKKTTGMDEQQIVQEIFTLIDDLFKDCENKKHVVIGIGLSCQGVVDVKEGSILSIHGVEKKGNDKLPIVEMLEKRYHTPARVERNAVCSLFEEFTKRNLPDAALVYLDQDVNFSVLLDSTIMMSGYRYDLGNFVVNPSETERSQGKLGRLSDYASMDGIKKRIGVSIEEIFKDPKRYSSVFDDCGYYLGLALYNAFLTFQFKELIFVGRLADHVDLFKPQLISSFNHFLGKDVAQTLVFSKCSQTNSAEAAAYTGIDAGLEKSLV
jgi:predicted NBD/HSP70 family sugar kinase